jgi:hypothetical protein
LKAATVTEKDATLLPLNDCDCPEVSRLLDTHDDLSSTKRHKALLGY